VTTDAPAPIDPDDDLPEQMRIRRDKRDQLAARGMEPYAVGLPITTTIADVRAAHPDLPPDTSTGQRVGLAGRVIFMRNTGKLCFATLRAGDGTQIQAMLSLANVGEDQLAGWKDLVDIGDHVFVRGEVITSKRGELSIMADEWRMAAKALRPLPVAHKPLNEETRVRQRYVDLITRSEAQQVARTRVAVMSSIRQSLSRRGFLEIETPMLQTLHGGAAARPFVTRSNAFDIDVFLRIAPELFLKRAVVGGLEKVFEVNRNFRNEGADRTHSPEFTMLEFYQAYADYQVMATLTREVYQEAALAACGSLAVEHHDGTVLNLSGVWPQIDLYESLSSAIGETITPQTPREHLVDLCERDGIEFHPTAVPGKLVEELFEHHVVATLVEPTFVMDYPVDTSPLVRGHRTKPGVVEKWDLYINGMESGTGYTELVDPVIQRERLMEQAALADRGDVEAMHLDEDFLRAMEHGMPPMGGVGVGVDRMLMAMTGLGIRETILFPLVKPEQRGHEREQGAEQRGDEGEQGEPG
jgi:lysyl-tRNA synthetase class 2